MGGGVRTGTSVDTTLCASGGDVVAAGATGSRPVATRCSSRGAMVSESGGAGISETATVCGGAVSASPAVVAAANVASASARGSSSVCGGVWIGLGTTGTSFLFLGAILAVVIYLMITKKDQVPPLLAE